MGIIMKILKSIWASLEHIGRIRAAGILAREGDTKGAIALMDKKFI
jgi:hypothetical protein